MEIAIYTERRRLLMLRRRRYSLFVPLSWQETPARLRARWWAWLVSLPTEEAESKAVASLVKSLPGWVRRRLPIDLYGSIALLLRNWYILRDDCENIAQPEYAFKGERYHLPMPRGENMSCVEFALADEFYKEYAAKQNIESLAMLTWALYREADQDADAGRRRGDIRVQLYTKMQVEHRLSVLGMPPGEMMVQAALFFGGMKRFLHDTFGEWIFETPDDPDDDSAPAPASTTPEFGWWGILQAVAESGVFGNLEQTYQASLYEVCVYLVRKNVERMKMESAKPSIRHDDLR